MARLPTPGEVAEWLKAADCKSAGLRPTLVRIQPSPPSPGELQGVSGRFRNAMNVSISESFDPDLTAHRLRCSKKRENLSISADSTKEQTGGEKQLHMFPARKEFWCE
jgi:hypothetical protein